MNKFKIISLWLIVLSPFIGLFLFFPKNETVQGSYDKKELSSIIFLAKIARSVGPVPK